MKTRIFFRPSRRNGKGMGHLIRSLALANMLKESFKCIFLCKSDDQIALAQVKLQGFNFLIIPDHLKDIREAKWISDSILKKKEIIVLDGYEFDTSYQSIIKTKAGKLVCIDDIHQTPFLADVIINHSGGISESDYDCLPNTRLMLGLDYLLLRPAFLENKITKKVSPLIKNMMICLGGEDPENETLKVLKKCEHFAQEINYTVILGSANKHVKSLLEFGESSNLSIKILQNVSARKMAEVMSKCDTAICPPSTVSLEFLSGGGNLFLYKIAENQNKLNRFLLSQKLAFPFEQLRKITLAERKMALQRQVSTIDGQSSKRLLKVFRSLDYDIHCKFRTAGIEDKIQYFWWANDPATRQQSFDSKPIKLEDHLLWFSKKLKDKNCCLYLMEYKNNPVGQVRFELKDNTALINYSLDQKYRGFGLGSYLLKASIQKLKTEHPNITQVEGYVKKENIASARAFQKLKFYQTSDNPSSFFFYKLLNTTSNESHKNRAQTNRQKSKTVYNC